MVLWVAHLDQMLCLLQQLDLPSELRLASVGVLGDLRDFAESGSLESLERGLGGLQSLAPQWEHRAAIAARLGTPWPTLQTLSVSGLSVTRQFGRHIIRWTCDQCAWQLTWNWEARPWEQAIWPGALSCPLCSTSSDDRSRGESLPNESGT